MTEVNYTRTARGTAVAICQCCDRRSRAVKPTDHGEPDLWEMPQGWSTAPFPADCAHDDGSVGSRFTCPACNKRLRKGETLALHNGRTALRTRVVS